jgi:endoglucanase
MRTTVLTSLSLIALSTGKILYAGVNEVGFFNVILQVLADISQSGGEFGVFSATATPGTGLPGQFGVDYAFINKTTVDIFVDQEKINTFRVAFLLVRVILVYKKVFDVSLGTYVSRGREWKGTWLQVQRDVL